MNKRVRAVLPFCLGLAVYLTACGSRGINVQEQLALGQKYLSEADYKQAVVAFSKVIEVEEKNVEANRLIAGAYSALDKPEEAAYAMLQVLFQWERTREDVEAMKEYLLRMGDYQQVSVLAQMAYAQTGDEDFLPVLFAAKGRQKDFDGIGRLIEDVEIVNGMKDKYMEILIQDYYDNQDMDSMKELAKVLEEKESCEGMTLALNLLAVYEEKGEEGIAGLLETYYRDEKDLPVIDAGSQVYIGSYDEDGLRSGFGICFYGASVKKDSRIYAGNWEKGLRSGEGRAYRTASYRIKCGWAQDYPEGEVTILQNSVTVLGSLSMGHVAVPMNLYENGAWSAVHCTPDSSRDSGYSFQTSEMDEPGTCRHVEKHSYCWDCRAEEQEKEEEEV